MALGGVPQPLQKPIRYFQEPVIGPEKCLNAQAEIKLHPAKNKDYHRKKPTIDVSHLVTLIQAKSPALQPAITISIKRTTSWHEIGLLFQEFSDKFNAINISAALCHLPKIVDPVCVPLRQRNEFRTLLMDMVAYVEEELPNCRQRELSNTAYALSKLGIANRRVMQLIVGRAQPHDMKAQEIANLIWALGACKHAPPARWLQEVLEDVVSRIWTFKNQELVNIVWALAQLRYTSTHTFMTHVFGEVEQHRLKTMSAQDRANLLWSAVSLQFSPPEAALEALVKSSASGLFVFAGKELAQFMFALGRLRHRPSNQWLSHLMVSGILPRVSALARDPRHLIIILLAFSRLRYRPPSEQLKQLCTALTPYFKRFRPQDTSNLMFALGKMHFKPEVEWLTALEMATVSQLEAFTPQDVTMSLWGAATLRHTPAQPWLRALRGSVLASSMTAFSPAHYSITLWSMARMCRPPSPRFVSLIFTSFVSRLEDMVLTPQQLANIMWALPRVVKIHKRDAFIAHHQVSLQAVQDRSQEMLPRCSAGELVQLALGFALLGFCPSNDWFQLHVSSMQKVEASMNESEKQQVAKVYELLSTRCSLRSNSLLQAKESDETFVRPYTPVARKYPQRQAPLAKHERIAIKQLSIARAAN